MRCGGADGCGLGKGIHIPICRSDDMFVSEVLEGLSHRDELRMDAGQAVSARSGFVWKIN